MIFTQNNHAVHGIHTSLFSYLLSLPPHNFSEWHSILALIKPHILAFVSKGALYNYMEWCFEDNLKYTYDACKCQSIFIIVHLWQRDINQWVFEPFEPTSILSRPGIQSSFTWIWSASKLSNLLEPLVDLDWVNPYYKAVSHINPICVRFWNLLKPRLDWVNQDYKLVSWVSKLSNLFELVILVYSV